MISKMGSLNPDLSLDFKPMNTTTYVPKTISDFLGELSAIPNVPETLSKLNDYVNRFEDEMRKIDAFKRELPLCMLLLNDAIVALKEESKHCVRKNVEPILEEFIPIKKTFEEDVKVDLSKDKDSIDKMNWMSSVQLWNCDSADKQIKSLVPFNGYSVSKGLMKEDKRELSASGLSLFTTVIDNPIEELGSSNLRSKSSGSKESSSSFPSARNGPHQQQPARKQRRCWSPELHRRFISALQQLGGSQVATPKQIRELMQVDGLTNDEVKSHLQKYRLHTRRVPGAAVVPKGDGAVILGNLFTPSDQCGESSKASNSQSDSPQGPLQLARGRTVRDSVEDEDEDDEDDGKSESYSWKSQVQRSGKDVV